MFGIGYELFRSIDLAGSLLRVCAGRRNVGNCIDGHPFCPVSMPSRLKRVLAHKDQYLVVLPFHEHGHQLGAPCRTTIDPEN